jgi:hypothetical protein
MAGTKAEALNFMVKKIEQLAIDRKLLMREEIDEIRVMFQLDINKIAAYIEFFFFKPFDQGMLAEYIKCESNRTKAIAAAVKNPTENIKKVLASEMTEDLIAELCAIISTMIKILRH